MEVAQSDRGDTRKVASVLLRMSLHYYDAVRKQAQQSFLSALGLACLGTVFFIVAAALVMDHPDRASSGKAIVSVIGGGLVHVISGINFYLYGRTARQFSAFHVCLERMNRFLVADSIAANLTGAKKDEVRAELVKIVAEAPMLKFEGLTDQATKAPGSSLS